MDGWQKVGAGLGALFNPNAGEEAYRARLTENLTLEQKMAAAGQDRLKMMAVERIANDPNLDPMTRDLLVGELGTQFSGVQQGRLREQEVGLRGEAFGRADAAGYGVNAPLIALAKGPVEFNKALAGGNLQGNTYLPGSELAVTELGLGEIFKDQAAGQASLARAGAAAAQANASNARAGLYTEQTTNPERFRTPPRGGSVDPGVYTTEDAMDAVEYNRMANRPGSGMTPIPVPTPGTPKAGAVAPTSTTESLPTIVSQAQYDALPSGAMFIDSEDGKTYRKP